MRHFLLKNKSLIIRFILLVITWSVSITRAAPPFSGTIFIDPDIIVPSDASAYESTKESGRGDRRMFDRRVNGWIDVNAFLFIVHFDDGLETEFQVNPEFGTKAEAEKEVLKIVRAIGRLPTVLRSKLETVWIHKGVELFGGGNNNILIHTGQTEKYLADGILEETLAHEAAHTSLDPAHAKAENWIEAQKKDNAYISTYARDNNTREDIAESFLPYLAIRHRSDRISNSLKETIEKTMPARIQYFDSLALDMYPIIPNQTTFLINTYRANSNSRTISICSSENNNHLGAYIIYKNPGKELIWNILGKRFKSKNLMN